MTTQWTIDFSGPLMRENDSTELIIWGPEGAGMGRIATIHGQEGDETFRSEATGEDRTIFEIAEEIISAHNDQANAQTPRVVHIIIEMYGGCYQKTTVFKTREDRDKEEWIRDTINLK